jgi:hypothetical protein
MILAHIWRHGHGTRVCQRAYAAIVDLGLCGAADLRGCNGGMAHDMSAYANLGRRRQRRPRGAQRVGLHARPKGHALSPWAGDSRLFVTAVANAATKCARRRMRVRHAQPFRIFSSCQCVCERVFCTTQSSIKWAISRLFFSSMTMCPFPRMPLSSSRTNSVLTPA